MEESDQVDCYGDRGDQAVIRFWYFDRRPYSIKSVLFTKPTGREAFVFFEQA